MGHAGGQGHLLLAKVHHQPLVRHRVDAEHAQGAEVVDLQHRGLEVDQAPVADSQARHPYAVGPGHTRRRLDLHRSGDRQAELPSQEVRQHRAVGAGIDDEGERAAAVDHHRHGHAVVEIDRGGQHRIGHRLGGVRFGRRDRGVLRHRPVRRAQEACRQSPDHGAARAIERPSASCHA